MGAPRRPRQQALPGAGGAPGEEKPYSPEEEEPQEDGPEGKVPPQEVAQEEKPLGPEEAPQGHQGEVAGEGEAPGPKKEGHQGAHPPKEGGEEEDKGAKAEGQALTLSPEVLGEAPPQGFPPVAPQGVAQEVAEETSQEEEGKEGEGPKASFRGPGAQGEEEGVPPWHEETNRKARLQKEGEGGEDPHPHRGEADEEGGDELGGRALVDVEADQEGGPHPEEEDEAKPKAVSYTHLTLPTNREV